MEFLHDVVIRKNRLIHVHQHQVQPQHQQQLLYQLASLRQHYHILAVYVEMVFVVVGMRHVHQQMIHHHHYHPLTLAMKDSRS